MNLPVRVGHIFYGTAMFAYGIENFVYGSFRAVLFPPLQFPGITLLAYLFGAFLAAMGVWIVVGRSSRNVLLILGTVLLGVFVLVQLPFQIFIQPHKIYHLGLWINPLKELALAGGAFVLAGASPELPTQSTWIRVIDKLTPYGNLLFCFTIASFGISHILYADGVTNLVPEWIGDRVFWNYFAAIALTGAGVCIILDIRMRAIAFLLSIMIFLWVFLLHLPAAYRDPMVDRGNNLSSAFDALAFSGIALTIAFGMKRQKWIADLEKVAPVES